MPQARQAQETADDCPESDPCGANKRIVSHRPDDCGNWVDSAGRELRSGTSTVPRTTATAVTSSRDFSGVWVVKTGQRSALMFNAKQELPLTVWGKQQFSAPRHAEQNKPRDVPNLTDPHTFCDPVGMPRVDLSKRPIEIVQTDAEMFVFYEEDHSWRQIYMDGRALPESPDPSYLGYSVGKWEGDTLVVDTGGLNDKTWLDGVGHPHSDSLHVVERLRRNGPDTLSLTVTIEDPRLIPKHGRLFRESLRQREDMN